MTVRKRVRNEEIQKYIAAAVEETGNRNTWKDLKARVGETFDLNRNGDWIYV